MKSPLSNMVCQLCAGFFQLQIELQSEKEKHGQTKSVAEGLSLKIKEQAEKHGQEMSLQLNNKSLEESITDETPQKLIPKHAVINIKALSIGKCFKTVYFF